MNRVKKDTGVLPPIDTSNLSHAVGKKMRISEHYTCLFIDEGTSVARSQHKAVLKASRIGTGYETLLVSVKSIVRALKDSSLKKLVHGRKTLVFPYPEWQGEPRSLVDFGGNESALGGDYVVLHDVERGNFLRFDQEKGSGKEVARQPPAPVEPIRKASPDAEPTPVDILANNAQVAPVAPLAPECIGRGYYFKLTADFQELPKKTEDESLRNYLLRVPTILRLKLNFSMREVVEDFNDYINRSSRFEVLQAARLFRHIFKNVKSASAQKLAMELNVKPARFSQINTLYEKWRRAAGNQPELQSDAWLGHPCGTLKTIENKIKAHLVDVV